MLIRKIKITHNSNHYRLEYFFKKDFIYLFMRHTERGRHRQREKQAPCREPDVGLHPGTAGSHAEPKADAQPLSHPGVSEGRKY